MNNPGADLSGTITLTSTTNDGGSGLASVTYQLSPANAGTWTNQAASWDTTGSPDGLYDLRVIAVDNAGNSTTSAVVEDRRVDNNAPAIDITAPVGIVNASAADPFTITASSPDADLNQVEFFECPTPACGSQTSIGIDTNAPYSVSRAIPADGNWTLKAVATDNALNTTSDIETVPSTGRARRRRSTPTRPRSRTRPAQPSASAQMTAARPSRSASTAAPGSPVRAPSSTAASATAPTPSTSAPQTPPATPTSPPLRSPGQSTPQHPTRRSRRSPLTRRAPRAPPSPSARARAARPSSAASTAAPGAPARAPRATARSPTARTPSRSAPPTRRATSTPQPASYTWLVDGTNPTGSITAPADAANVRDTIALTSNSADTGGSGVDTVQFQRSPIGAGSWTNQAASWDTTAQADGQYDLRVLTTDNAGNTYTSATITVRVDNTAPTATMGNPGADLSGTVILTSTTNDGGSGLASITYQLSPANANTWTNQAASWDTTGSPDGLYDLRVIAVDNAGNSTTSAVVEDRRVDNNPPAIEITAPLGIVNASAADPFTITASSPDADLTQVEFFECPTPACGSQTSIGVDTTAPYSVSRAIPADGSWTLKVVATDNALNTMSDIETVTVERTRPQTAIDTNPASITNQTGATFTFSSNESGVTYEVRLDGGAWITDTSPKLYSGLSDGPHTFDVRATDAAGNTDLSPASFAWTVDTTAPNTTITGNPSNPTNATGATFSFTSSEGSSTFECRLDGGAWGSCTTPSFYGSLAEGSHTFEVRATDAASNTDATPATFNWSIDFTSPTGSITSPADGARVRATILLASNSADGGSGIASVVFERSPAGAGTWTATPDELGHDARRRRGLRPARRDLRCGGQRHGVGRRSPSRSTTRLRTRRITSQPADPTNATGASFSFSSEAGASFEVRLDGGAWSPSASPASYSGLAEGSHTFEVRATDLAGNVDATPAAFTWTVDTTAPNTNITSQPADPTNSTGASFAFTSTEVGSSFEVRLDGSAWSAEHEPDGLQRPERGLAHVPGTRDRRRRQPGRDSGELHLDRRHDGAELVLRVDPGRPEQRHDADVRLRVDRGARDLRGQPRRRRLGRRLDAA